MSNTERNNMTISSAAPETLIRLILYITICKLWFITHIPLTLFLLSAMYLPRHTLHVDVQGLHKSLDTAPWPLPYFPLGVKTYWMSCHYGQKYLLHEAGKFIYLNSIVWAHFTLSLIKRADYVSEYNEA